MEIWVSNFYKASFRVTRIVSQFLYKLSNNNLIVTLTTPS